MAPLTNGWARLSQVLKLRKNFIEIDDAVNYKRCRVQLHARGIVLRDDVKGLEIKTKRQQVCRAGDFLVAEIDAKMGGYGLVPQALDAAIVSSHYFLFEIDETQLDREFLAYFIRTEAFSEQVRAQGSTNYAAIRPANVLGYQMPLPPLAEQQTRVDRLNAVSRLHERLTAANTDKAALLRQLRQAILREAVQGKLVPQNPNDEPASALLEKIRAEKVRLIKEGKLKKEKPLPPITADEIPYTLPKGWEWVRFGNVAHIESNLTDPEKHPNVQHIAPDNIEKATGVLRQCRTVAEDGVASANHIFYPGHILYSKIRPALSKVVVVDFGGLCSADMYPIRALIHVEYLHRYMLSPMFLAQVIKQDNRVKMPKVNQQELNTVLVAVPPSREQARIGAQVKALLVAGANLEAEVELASEQSQRLMQLAIKEALLNTAYQTA